MDATSEVQTVAASGRSEDAAEDTPRGLASTASAWLDFLRLRDWYYLLGVPAIGLLLPPRTGSLGAALPLLISAALYLAHGYGVNHYFDVALGERSAADLMARRGGRTSAAILCWATLLANLVLSLLLLGPAVAALVLAGAAVSYLYSSDRAALKQRLSWNLVLNSTGFTLLFAMGYLSTKPADATLLLMSGYIWLGIIPFQAVHLMSHQETEAARLPPGLAWFNITFYGGLVAWCALSLAALAGPAGLLRLLPLITLGASLAIILAYRFRSRSGNPGLGDLAAVRRRLTVLSIIIGCVLLIGMLAG